MAFSLARTGTVSRSRAVAVLPSASSTFGLERATPDRTVLGIVAILASTVCYPLSDLAAQSLTQSLPPLEVAWLRYLVFVLAVLPLVARAPHHLRTARPGLQLLRGTASTVSTLAAIVAFSFLPVAEATAIIFVYPVMVTALAVLLLGETAGPWRWGAALAALGGVLIIVRPGGDAFSPAALVPLGGAAAGAVVVVATRLNRSDAPATTMIYSAGIGFALLSALVVRDWQTPTLAQWSVALAVGAFGTIGTLLQVLAYRMAPAALLSPFTYMQLVWAAGLSTLVLGTAPSGGMVVGGTVIVASAGFTAWRERVRGAA